MDTMKTLDRIASAVDGVLKDMHGGEAAVRIVTEVHERLLSALNRLKTTGGGGVPADLAAELRSLSALLATVAERYPSPSYPAASAKRMGPDAFAVYALDQVQKAAKDAPERAVRRLRALGRAVETAKQSFVDTESEQIEVEVFEEETTAAADKSEKEISPVAAEPALGNSAFAENAEDLQKKLDRLGKELGELRGGGKPAADKVAKADEAAWPSDMNTPEFREGVRKAETDPTWGRDPARVRRPEA